LKKPQTPPTPPPTDTKTIPTIASEILRLDKAPQLEDLPSLRHKAILSIITKANHKLAESIRKREDALYIKSPHKYHNNLKTMAGLQPKANEQPRLATIRVPHTDEITSNSQIILDALQTHVASE